MHQVLRAIDGYSYTSYQDRALDADLLGLARAPEPEVSRAACLAYAHLEPWRVPHAELLERARDPELAPELRQAALLGFSYGPDPIVNLTLLEVAGDPGDPTWPAAVSRLGDIGDATAAGRLSLLDRTGLSAEYRSLLEAELGRIQERESALDAHPTAFAGSVRRMLERAAYAGLQGDLAGISYRSWAFERVLSRAQVPEVRAVLLELRATYEPGPELEDQAVRAELRDWVRRHADLAFSGS